MNDLVTPLDATFLELEEADESAHMHIGALLAFDGQPAPSLERFRADMEARLGPLPRYRQRLSEPRTGALSWPTWQVDQRFDIANHVSRAALPAPGGDEELMSWLGDYWSHRLERRRPLWEAVLLEGLTGGRWAIVTKTHHSMVDGVGSVDVGYLLLDSSASGSEPPAPAPAPRPPHGPLHDVASGSEPPAPAPAPAPSPPHGPLHDVASAAAAGVRAALHPRRMAERAAALTALLIRDELIAAPTTSLNAPIGTTRRFDVVRVRLSDLKRIKNALGGTVNDVALAATTAGLRELLIARGEQPPDRPMRAMVPVNIRAAGEHLALGNRITSLFVELPVAGDSTSERYRRTLVETGRLKHGSQALGSQTVIDVAGLAPPVLHSVLARSLFASRLFNVTITNVPGSKTPLYAFGSRLVEVCGLVPLAAEHAVGVAILSYDGEVTFGLIVDRDTVPDLAVMKAGMEAELEELGRLARRTKRRRSRAHAAAATP